MSQTRDAKLLRGALEEAIQGRHQARACAIVDHYGALDLPSRPLKDLLLQCAIADDGALHAEKYYWTAVEEFDLARPAFRWRHLIGLARVAASQRTIAAPGVDEARVLLRS